MLGAEFLAVIQVIVYTGAILVLLLFVLMLVDPDDLPEFHQGRPVQRVVGGLLGLILLLEIAVAILNREVVGQQGSATPDAIAAVAEVHGGSRFPARRVSVVSRPTTAPIARPIATLPT